MGEQESFLASGIGVIFERTWFWWSALAELGQNSGLEAQTNSSFLAPLIAKAAIVKRFAQVTNVTNH
jgi:hypothetical protein